MSVSPKMSLYLNLLAGFLVLLSSGALYRPSFISIAAAHDIAGIAGGMVVALNLVLHSISSTEPGPLATKTGGASTAACLALVGLSVAFALLSPDRADAASKTPAQMFADIQSKITAINTKISGVNAKAGLTGSATTDANALVAKIQTISLADLRAALDDANKTGDTLASSCYAPLADLVAAQQSVVVPGQNTDNPGASVPTTHLVLDFQRGRDFYNALRPGSKVSIGCAPLAEQVKTDIVTLIAQIAAGTLTMASFGL